MKLITKQPIEIPFKEKIFLLEFTGLEIQRLYLLSYFHELGHAGMQFSFTLDHTFPNAFRVALLRNYEEDLKRLKT